MPDDILVPETLAVALGMIMVYSPVIALILARKRLGALKTATALVIWGTLIPTFEHASFAMYGSRTIASVPGHGLHLHYHFFMAGIFTVVAGIMIMIMAASQLRQGKRTGWYAILAALLIGGGFELSGAAGTLFHGFQTSWKLGLVIYAYPLAWASALVLSYRPVFENKEKSHERPRGVVMRISTFNTERVGGIVLIAAAVIMLAGAAVASFTLARSQTGFGAGPDQMVAAIAAHPSAWRLADVLILVAIILTAFGLVPITLGFGKAGRAWAWVGLLAYAISVVLGTTRRIVSIYLEPWVAVEGIDPNNITVEAFSRFGEGLGEWFTILAFTAVALYGMALLRRPESGSIGWPFIGGGAVGVLLHLVGAGIPAFIFLETGALGVVIFMRERFAGPGET